MGQLQRDTTFLVLEIKNRILSSVWLAATKARRIQEERWRKEYWPYGPGPTPVQLFMRDGKRMPDFKEPRFTECSLCGMYTHSPATGRCFSCGQSDLFGRSFTSMTEDEMKCHKDTVVLPTRQFLKAGSRIEVRRSDSLVTFVAPETPVAAAEPA